MKRKLMYLLIGIAAVLGIVISLNIYQSHVSEPDFTVIKDYGNNLELRDYDPMIVAEVELEDERMKTLSQGFRILFDYITGENADTKKISMTAPVSHQPLKSGGWKVSFVMPKDFEMDDLPNPNREDVKLERVGRSKFAVLTFTGKMTQENLDKHREILERLMVEAGELKPKNYRPVYSLYNPPWTLPFMRRNEVMYEVR